MFVDTNVIVRARMPGAPRHVEANTLLATYAGLGEPLKIRGGTQTPLDSRFRGNDGVEIGNNSAIIESLRPLRLRAFASNSLYQHALGTRAARSRLLGRGR